ncbi:MAG: hypothetical protein WBB31_14530, partial [Saprospiraceae bacterium]
MDSLILTAYAFGGAEPYSYLWSTGETTVSIYALNSSTATYSVTITGITGCTASGSITLGLNVAPYINASATQSCENFPIYLDATFLFLVVPPPGVTWLWSTGATTESISVLNSGTYSVTLTDPANGCTYTLSQPVTFLPAPTPVITGPLQICGGQSITLNATGGPYNQYLWLPTLQSTPSISVNTPGTYIVQVQDGNFCYGYDTVTVMAGAAININGTATQLTSCNTPNGMVNITISPSGSYTYQWSNGATTEDITNLQAGQYTVTVSDGANCSITASFTVDDGTTVPLLSSLQSAATCGQNNGSIDLTIAPSGTYLINWSNGLNTEDIVNITAGTYSVTVTSASGCSSTEVIVVPDNSVSITLAENITPNTSCILNNGAIALNVTPVSTYTFLWSNGAITEDLSNLAPGNYSVTVTKGINCISIGNYVVANQTNAPAIQSISSPASCGESNGSIDLQISNGIAPFTFLWSNGNTTQGIVNVAANTYSVTVTGSNGCTSATTIDLPGNSIPINISGQTSPNTSCINSNGSIDITISPAGAYTFQWSTGATTEDLFNIGGGTFDVTVTLGINCIQTASFTVDNQNIPFSVLGSSSSNTSCTSPNGSIDLTVTPAGA